MSFGLGILMALRLMLWAWTQPKTWTNEPLIAGDLNTHLRDNLEALKAPPTDTYVLNESGDYSSASTSWVDINATTLSLDITTSGGDILVHFHGSFRPCSNAGEFMYLDITRNGSRVGGDDGMLAVMRLVSAAPIQVVTFSRLLTGIPAGTHQIRLQWRMSAGTSVLYTGAGTATLDLHPQFWAREI